MPAKLTRSGRRAQVADCAFALTGAQRASLRLLKILPHFPHATHDFRAGLRARERNRAARQEKWRRAPVRAL
jgi:hypothetical protein